MLRGDWQEAVRWADLALVDAERGDALSLVAHTLVTKGSALASTGRWREGTGLIDVGRRLAEENGLWTAHLRAIANLGGALAETDPRAGVAAGRSGWEIAKRHGYQRLALTVLGNTLEISLLFLGDWGRRHASSRRSAWTTWAPASGRRCSVRSVWSGRSRSPAWTCRKGGPMSPVSTRGSGAGSSTTRRSSHSLSATFGGIRVGSGGRSPVSNAPNGTLVAARAAARAGDRGLVAEMLAAHDALGVFGPAHIVNRDGIAAAILALDGRWPEATVAFRDAIRRMADLGLEMSRAQILLDAAFVAPPGDAFGVEAAQDARELFERMGARAFVAQVDALLARSRPEPEGSRARSARAGVVGRD